MLFNSYLFIFCFLPVVLLGFFTFARLYGNHVAKLWLICASLGFYAWLGKEWTFLLVGSALFNFIIGQKISASQATIRKIFLASGVLVNIGLLAYFKYRHEFVFGLNIFFDQAFTLPQIILPLAISFFSFHQVAYLVDIDQKRVDAETNFPNYLLFISFFPHLIAGPILYYREIKPQLFSNRLPMPDINNLKVGFYLFALGLIKKTCIADPISTWVNNGFAHAPELNRGESIAVTYLFGLQLYFDFSGYCDMALGLARMFNISFPLNFNSPYKAANLQEFWLRWHITLGRFFRDYVYFPLGGNRLSFGRQQWNLLIVMVLSGLWHGSNWLFFLWGLWHGVGMVILQCWRKTKIHLPRYIGQLLTVNFWVLSLVFFRSTHWNQAATLYSNIFSLSQNEWLLKKEHFITDSNNFYWLLATPDNKDIVISALILFSLMAGYLVCLLCNNATQIAERSPADKHFWIKLGVVMTLGVAMLAENTPFIYFQF